MGFFHRTIADADLLLDAAVGCGGLRRDVGIVAYACFCGSERVFWVLPHRGPCWTWSAQERGVNGVGSAQGCGVLTWECAGSLAGGNIFLSVPLDGTVLLFSVPMSAGDPDGPVGSAGGGCSHKGPTKEPSPLRVRGTSAGRNKSREGDGF